MEVIVKENKSEIEKEIKYPYIGIIASTNCIVLFTSPDVGICLRPGSSKVYLFEFSNAWGEILFKPFHGEITLRND